MGDSKKQKKRRMDRVSLLSVILLVPVGVLVFLTVVLALLAYTPIAEVLGIGAIRPWQRVLVAGGVVTLSAAVVGLVISYRKQRDAEDSKVSTEFANAAAQLGGESASVRIAGVYAMAALADQSAKHRQRCIDVLCGHLRIPYDPEVGISNVLTRTVEDRESSGSETSTFKYVPGEREVRLTIIRMIRDHLRPNAETSWSGYDFDFTGAVFDGGDFSKAHFEKGLVSFDFARFVYGTTDFSFAEFSGGKVSFSKAEFVSGIVSFIKANFSGGDVQFLGAEFSGARVAFTGATISAGEIDFMAARVISGEINCWGTTFADGKVNFAASFTGGRVECRGANFIGGSVDLSKVIMGGGEVDFSRVGAWKVPPLLPRPLPGGIYLPLSSDEP